MKSDVNQQASHIDIITMMKKHASVNSNIYIILYKIFNTWFLFKKYLTDTTVLQALCVLSYVGESRSLKSSILKQQLSEFPLSQAD